MDAHREAPKEGLGGGWGNLSNPHPI